MFLFLKKKNSERKKFHRSRAAFFSFSSRFVCTPAARQQLLKSFQCTSSVALLHNQVFFFSLTSECSFLRQTRAHFPLCRRGDVMLFQRGKQRVVTCTAAALTHSSQVGHGFPAGGRGQGNKGAEPTRFWLLYQSRSFDFSLSCCSDIDQPPVGLWLCWPILAVRSIKNDSHSWYYSVSRMIVAHFNVAGFFFCI